MKFRIIEETRGNGKTSFYPQYKTFLFWHYFYGDLSRTYGLISRYPCWQKIVYDNFDDARWYIVRNVKWRSAELAENTIVSKQIHNLDI